jgi:hypothetical protein
MKEQRIVTMGITNKPAHCVYYVLPRRKLSMITGVIGKNDDIPGLVAPIFHKVL